MREISGWLSLASICFCVMSSASHASAAQKPELGVLYSFNGGNDGAFPLSTLVVDQAGNLYGTTGGGGVNPCLVACGTVFKLSIPSSPNGTWKETVLYRFTGGTDGGDPMAGLVFDAVGNFYGTAYLGGTPACPGGGDGCGVVFELSPPAAPGGAWTETVLHSFLGSEGGYPEAGLVFDQMGNLYGTTLGGGSGSGCTVSTLTGCGVVFELIAPATQGAAWTYSVLHNFTEDGTDGLLPTSNLVFDQAGNLYGTTTEGGAGVSNGTVFELESPAWTETILYSFAPGANGSSGPHAGVIFDQAGNLYGTTQGGGTRGEGTVFELTPKEGVWTESVLFNGGGHVANFAQDLIFDTSGNLYGAGEGGGGALFRLQNQRGDWIETEIDLIRGDGGPVAPSGLVFGKFCALFGTSYQGGVSQNCRNGCGTVFGVIP
jgi:uncharacterized repeat protein (TIGR03803 family)